MGKIGWIIFSAVTVAVLGGLIAWNYIANPPIDVSNINEKAVIAALEENGNIADHTKGSKDNKIILTEYGDYQCPGCGGAFPNVTQLMTEYNDSVTFVFRNMPLTTIHPNARAAATAAEAAGLQGKYWEMHNQLYEGQSSWSNADPSQRLDIFLTYAEGAGLNIDQFKKDLESPAIAQKLKFDLAITKKAGVDSTPTFFLNGELVDDETAQGIVKGDLSKIKAKIDALINKQK